MTTLKNLKGTAIQFLDADPVVYVGAWSSGGALNTARSGIGAAGTQTATLGFGGNNSVNTEIYNGSSWTEVNNLNTARKALGNAGIQTAALAFAGNTGSVSAVTEEWSSSSDVIKTLTD